MIYISNVIEFIQSTILFLSHQVSFAHTTVGALPPTHNVIFSQICLSKFIMEGGKKTIWNIFIFFEFLAKLLFPPFNPIEAILDDFDLSHF